MTESKFGDLKDANAAEITCFGEKSMMTSALLRLSKSITRQQKEQLVEDIIKELGLGDCANVLVGSEKDDIKGISGGQIKQLAVGVELVTRPRVIVLDEPTSGLDSEIALTIMTTLKSLTQNGRTVVCSIHQPNSDTVGNFDDLHLAANGRTVFRGPWDQTVPFFDQAGHKYENMNKIEFPVFVFRHHVLKN